MEQEQKYNGIIVDLDGCLFDPRHRLKYIVGDGPKDWERFYAPEEIAKDQVINATLQLVRGMIGLGVPPIFVTGRQEGARFPTIRQLGNVDLDMFPVFMRPEGDFRKSVIIKSEIYEREIVPRWEILFAIEDEPTIAAMWKKEKGILTFFLDSGHWEPGTAKEHA